MRLLITPLLITLFPIIAPAAEKAPSEKQLLSWLRELKPLPKVHYSWPLPFRTISDDLLYEYARLTHAVSVAGEWHTEAQIDRAVRICKRVNGAKPKIPATIGVNYSVWHRRFGKKLPPTDSGKTHKAELDYQRQRLTALRDLLAAANRKHNTNVVVSAILFDSERFHVKKDDDKWNAAITTKYNAAYDLAREVFPKVRIEWYARGAVQPGASNSGWNQASYFTLKEKGESFGCSLYQVPEIGVTRDIFRKTADNAVKHGVKEVTPWIALASGYRRQVDKYHTWSHNWEYDLIYSWKLGAEVNNAWYGAKVREQRFAPWRLAKVAIFYPEPFGRSRLWGLHFVAYVRGANGIRKLPGK